MVESSVGNTPAPCCFYFYFFLKLVFGPFPLSIFNSKKPTLHMLLSKAKSCCGVHHAGGSCDYN